MGRFSKGVLLLEPGTILQERFKVIERIGQGGFGQVYRGVNLLKSSEIVAIKTEMRQKSDSDHDPRRFVVEKDVMIRCMGKRHIPNIYAAGKAENGCPYVVMEMLGANLDSLRTKQQRRRFSISTTVRASHQYLHRAGFIHRDLKPGNTCIGKLDVRTVYIIDFGMCRRFYDPETSVWRKMRKRAHFRGTYRYASLRTHQKKETGPSDDLECWVYSFVEMGVKRLPWSSSSSEEILGKKHDVRVSELCRGAPDDFKKFAKIVLKTPPDKFPDYDVLHVHLRKCLVGDNEYVRKYDWEMDGNDTDAFSEE